MASTNKNLTVTMTKEEHEELDYLVDFFQDQSISTVTRSDVIKFLIKNMKQTIEKGKFHKAKELLKED